MSAGCDNPNVQPHFVPSGDLQIAVWEWPGVEPAIVFAHATGFHGRCWDPIIRNLPGRRCVAVDLRGHGRSSKPAPPYHWRSFGEDVNAAMRALGIDQSVGVGHSMGGHSIVSAASQRPQSFAAMLLIDPTLFRPERYGQTPFDASFILKRRNRWSSPEEMFERFRSRPPFASWHPEALRAYCDFALLPDGGSFVLACPPAIETDVYGHSNEPQASLYSEIPTLPQPVTILRAGKQPDAGASILARSPAAPDLASKSPHGRDLLLPDHDHYIPMTDPALVARQISLLIEQP